MTRDSNALTANPQGSIWHRWDPHIHMPGTLKNDNFKGEEQLAEYARRINACDPPIRAIGITDYYILDSYEKLRQLKERGDLPHLELIFPNIELRFAVNAGKGSPVNVHLLVCPDDDDHIAKTKRFLRELKFDFNGEDYGCTNDELIRLGYAFKADAENDAHALRLGVEQSKITPRGLKDAFKGSKWAQDNIMVAIAGGSGDGTAQLRDSGLMALREELQRLADIVFSGNPSDRRYWCGQGPDSAEVLREKYRGLKPCLHGSDAHDFDKVGNPDEGRLCWIRGDLTFETLRQICFEPESRVYIGTAPSFGGRPSNTITGIEVENAGWMTSPKLLVNPGLVAIIGSRGSGKTALVEMIAAAAESFDGVPKGDDTDIFRKRSFLERASEHLEDVTAELSWGDEGNTKSSVHLSDLSHDLKSPRVRYLSQQFVDRLCSSDGLADELVTAIERVIFEAHPPDQRYTANSFEELRDIKTQSVRRRKERYSEAIREIGDEISIQDDLRRNLDELKRKRANEAAAIQRMKNDRKQLTPTDDKVMLAALEKVRDAAEAKSSIVADLEKKELSLSSLQEEAKQFRETEADLQLGQLKFQYEDAGLTDRQWENFSVTYQGDVDALLMEQIAAVKKDINIHKGPSEGEAVELDDPSKARPYFETSADLSKMTHSLLLKEQNRLESRIGVSATRRRKYTELSNKIVRAETALKRRDAEIKKAGEAPNKIKELLKKREEAYKGLVGEVEREAGHLQTLYRPLQDRLDAQEGTLNRLTFSVNRTVDMDAWGEAGERLFDRSRAGAFKGIGTLTEKVKAELADVWNIGDAKDIAEAMSAFRKKYRDDFWNHIFDDAAKTRESKKHWSDQVSSWLYSTDHVEVSYGLQYEGLDIEQLSPGTRGIVLLLLYLSIDVDDERPLIIDQPEENLDPKSIFQELVGRFKEAKTRRQIIIVTHNANLVVNTDADQVIVASRGEHKPKSLPDMSYVSGGLENPEIRAAVCDILEGGEQAFAERAARLRVEI